MKTFGKKQSTVVLCYDLLDIAVAGGIQDFTDGMYYGNPDLDYEIAQNNQTNWLLDQIRCNENTRILDIDGGMAEY